jgi:hypothetical protein
VSRGNFRLPELGTEQSQIQVVPTAVSNPVNYPVVNRNQELAQILGIIESVGTVFNKYEQTLYYFNQTKRARMGMAADAAESAATPLADAFGTGTVSPDFLAQIGDVPPQDLPAALRSAVRTQALSAADQAGVADDEREAFVRSYDANVMRYALPWARNIIDTQRSEIATSMSSDLARNTPPISESFAEWSSSALLGSLGWNGYVDSVLVPALTRTVETNDVEATATLLTNIASTIDKEHGATPALSRLMGAATDQVRRYRLTQAIDAMGTAMAAGQVDLTDDEVSFFTDAIRIGGRDEQFTKTVRAAADEMLDANGFAAKTRLHALMNLRDDNNALVLRPGHPVRDAMLDAISANTPVSGETETARTNDAKAMMLEGIATNMAREDLVKMLQDRFGQHGLRYFAEHYTGLWQNFNEAVQADPSLYDGIDRQILLSGTAESLAAMRENVIQHVGSRLSGSQAKALITQIDTLQRTLPLNWNANADASSFQSDLYLSFWKVDGGTVSNALSALYGGKQSADSIKKWTDLSLESQKSWNAGVTAFLTNSPEIATRYQREGLTAALANEFFQTWRATEGERLLERARTLGIPSTAQSPAQAP